MDLCVVPQPLREHDFTIPVDDAVEYRRGVAIGAKATVGLTVPTLEREVTMVLVHLKAAGKSWGVFVWIRIRILISAEKIEGMWEDIRGTSPLYTALKSSPSKYGSSRSSTTLTRS